VSRLVRGVQERELASVTRKLDGLIDAMADGFRAPRLQVQLDELEVRRSTLEAGLKAPAAPVPPRLHPNLAELYRARVARLQEALRSPDDGRAALEAVRELIERIEVRPTPEGKGLEIELIGAIASMVRLELGNDATNPHLGTSDRGLFARSVKVVAGAGNHRQLTLPPMAC
jgi:hypothetical protein